VTHSASQTVISKAAKRRRPASADPYGWRCKQTADIDPSALTGDMGMKARKHRPYRHSPRQSRPSRPASSWHRPVLLAGIVGVCVVLAAVVLLDLPTTRDRRDFAHSEQIRRSRVQKAVTVLLAGIPQQGAILGKSTAPVTLQVFLDLEDYLDATNWFDGALPTILEKFVRTNVVRLEFRSFKTDTLNGGPFIMQQTAALAAGAQDRLWNYAATFMNEQGREFTNYVNEAFVIGIARQVPRLNLAEWEKSRTAAMSKVVMADNYEARYRLGLYATPAFRIGLTGGPMKNYFGGTVTTTHKYIVRTKPSGERYIAGISPEWQRPVSLIDAQGLRQAVKELLCRQRPEPCPALEVRRR
jgi:hypothetical protein